MICSGHPFLTWLSSKPQGYGKKIRKIVCVQLSLKIAVRCMSCPILSPKTNPQDRFLPILGTGFLPIPKSYPQTLKNQSPGSKKTNPQKPIPGSVFEVKPIGIDFFEKPIGIGFFQDRMLRVCGDRACRMCET